MEILFRPSFVDDDVLCRCFVIGRVIEQAPGKQRDFHHGKIVGSDIPDVAFVLVACRHRAALDEEADGGPAAGERDNAARSDSFNAGKTAKTIGEPLVEANRVRILGIRSRRKIHKEDQEVLCVKAGITIHQRSEALHHQG